MSLRAPSVLPSGSGSELQYRSGPYTLGSVANVSRGANGNLLLAAQTTPVSLTDGEIFQGTQKALAFYVNGVTHRMGAVLFTQTANGVCGNTTNETNIIGTGIGTLTLPADYLVPGKVLRWRAFGYYSSHTTGTNNLTLAIKLGATAVNTTGAVTVTNSLTNLLWGLAGEMVCQTVGAPGSVQPQMQGFRASSVTGQTIVNPAQLTPAGVTTTGSLAVTLTATWSAAQTLNTITCTNFTLEVLN